MNKMVGFGIIILILIGVSGYFYLYIYPFGPMLNNPDYDEELSINIVFEKENNFSLFLPVIYTVGGISQAYKDLVKQHSHDSDSSIQIELKQINGTTYMEINGTNQSKYGLYSNVIFDKFADPNFNAFKIDLIYFESSSGFNGFLSISHEVQDGKYQGLSGCRYGYHIFENEELSNGWNFYAPRGTRFSTCA